ncbi:MAG TPA: sigma-70 family RNA polymerase sigma factor [Pirellulales bacterium]|jgi:RNA polymerase sigma-70 factor (ECF subfamily)|nr:sigma-70 family RNA polymerase sigma factor [Pirellulales bacterium]
MTEADQKFIDRFAASDRDALGDWLLARRPALSAYIERRLGMALRCKIEAEDLVQEVNADAIRSAAEIDFSKRDPFGWLCQIAERRIIDAHRRFFGSQKRSAGRERSMDAGVDSQGGGLVDLLVASMTTASQAFSRDQRQIRLLAALESLPEDQRTALRLRYLEGLPSKEIAQRLEKTDGAIRVMLTRSLAKLQELLEE